jgi:hypothetical protein
MNYIFFYDTFENKITKLYLIDLYNEIEYHKLEWGNVQREFNEKWFCFIKPFFYVSEENFKKILNLKGKEFYDISIISFFKKHQLEELLI